MGKRGRIFISYRRDDAPADARGIYDRLRQSFGKANVFMDVDKLLAGQRFDRELDKALSQCNVLIVIIGSRWVELLSEYARAGRRDYVHDEIAAALRRDISVIPVLTGREGHMPLLPRREDLPEDIRDLVQYQRHVIAHESFHRDAVDLITAIRFALSGHRAKSWWGTAIFCTLILAVAAVVFAYRMDSIPFLASGSGLNQPRSSEVGSSASLNPDAIHTVDKAADEAAQKKAADEAAQKKAADEAAQKKAADEAAQKKAADEAAQKKAADEAAQKKAADEAAQKKAADEATKKAAADKKAADETARKKADEQAKLAAADCDRLAASPFDPGRSNGVAGVDFTNINSTAATTACDDAVRRNPTVTRLVYQDGRAAHARGDYVRAAQLYRTAIDQGSAAAMNDLGVLYEYGLGVPQSYGTARTWYEKAAALNHAVAMFSLGNFYERGQGLPADRDQARKWYQKSADAGYSYAKERLKNLK